MDIKYVYVKTRSEFGKQCIFDIYGPKLDEEIKPNPQEMRNYIAKSPCHVGTQYTKQIALHEVQTAAVNTKNSGIYHYEGGWPKEIHPGDHETTARFRRRVEKGDEWAPKLRYLLANMEHCILSNNAIDIHNHYFDDMIPTSLTTEREIRLINVFPDQEKPGRSVNDIGWSPDDTKMVVSYPSVNWNKNIGFSRDVYIWDLESPNRPYMALKASYPTLLCQFNPRDPFVLAGGLITGQVCYWDVRMGIEPIRVSNPRNSHRYPTTAVKWIYTKTNTEFFTSSWDGQALWWDTRNLRYTTDRLIFDLENPNEPLIERSIGISSANFEPSMSTKFMFGLQNGIVVSGSRKVKTNAEKLSMRFNAHNGPVLSVDRNAFNPKVFLTVGSAATRIWAEDTREGSLITIRNQRYSPIQAYWNKIRHSLFYVIKENGQLEVYDILESTGKPIIELHLSEVGLTTMAPHDNGSLLAVGGKNGNIFLIRSTDALGTFDRQERNILTTGLDRNSKHVKAVDARVKEIKILRILDDKLEPALVRKSLKIKKKSKHEMKKDKIKPVTREDSSKTGRDRNRRSTRKRFREDISENTIVEAMFFQIVDKEKEKLESDEDPNLRYSTLLRKFDPKQLKHRTKGTEEERDPFDEDKKKKRKIKPIVKMTKKMSLELEIKDDEILKTCEPDSDVLKTETVVSDEIVPIKSPIERRKIKKEKKMVKKFDLRLRKPCKIVCQPKVCCWRKTWRRKKYRSRMKNEKTDLTLTSDDSKGFLRDVLLLPVELDKAINIAKREIRRAKKPINWNRKKLLVDRVLLAREIAKEKSERRAKKSKREKDKSDKYSDIDIVCTKEPKSKTRDSCIPPKSWTVIKEIENLLIPKPEETIEHEEVLSKAYFEELEAIESRVYPRISDFYSIE